MPYERRDENVWKSAFFNFEQFIGVTDFDISFPRESDERAKIVTYTLLYKLVLHARVFRSESFVFERNDSSSTLLNLHSNEKTVKCLSNKCKGNREKRVLGKPKLLFHKRTHFFFFSPFNYTYKPLFLIFYKLNTHARTYTLSLYF